MAAFIVISADNRLHHLVDGITSCRPLNSDVEVKLSTGLIIDDNGSLTYKYTIPGGDASNGDKKDFSTLFANQLAQFRLQCHIANNGIVNIFLLENPLTAHDFEQGQWWQDEIQRVYDEGHDKSFRLIRVLFSYDVLNPADVVEQVPVNHLRHVLSDGMKSDTSFESYVFYVDNQKCDAAAMSVDKDDHDLKMPRMLCDFMMLASNSIDSYGVLQAIHNVGTVNRAFSVGYAESMYYYDDVKRYFILADMRDLHYRMLHNEDETTSDMKDKDRMLVERHPFGLFKRRQMLMPKYSSVPFTEDINEFATSAEKQIDESILYFRDLVLSEREYERQEFQKTDPVSGLISEKDNLVAEYQSLKDLPEEEKDSSYAEKLKYLEREIEKVGNQIAELIESFEPDCPEFICRDDIYARSLSFDDEEEKAKYISEAGNHYNRLVDFVRSNTFSNYIKTVVQKEQNTGTGGQEPVQEKNVDYEKREGCLGKLLSIFGKKRTKENILNREEHSTGQNSGSKVIIDEAINHQKSISKLLQLKKQFQTFCSEVDSLEHLVDDEDVKIRGYKLTDHTSHYFHLINLHNLRSFQKDKSKERLDQIIEDWRNEVAPEKQTRTSIEHKTEDSSKTYAAKFQYVNWEDPFVFVNRPNSNELSQIVNELNKMSAPCAHYYNVTALAENIITKNIYSDISNISALFSSVKNKINDSDCIGAITSRHIASKICFMQFLPMDEDVIAHLTDFSKKDQEQDDDGCDDIDIPKGEVADTSEEPIIDWGEKSS